MNEQLEQKLEVVKGDILGIVSDYTCITDRHASDEKHLELMRNDLDSMKNTNDQVLHQYLKISKDAKNQLQYISYMLPLCQDSAFSPSTASSVMGDTRSYRRYDSFHDFYKLRLPHDEHRRLFEHISGTKVDEYLDAPDVSEHPP